MEKRIPYSLYKSGYSDFPARDYDSATKTILVELPEYKKPNFPRSWRRIGNSYITENGARVVFWSSGLSENFVIESGAGHSYRSKTIPAGLYAREKVLAYLEEMKNA